MYKFTGLDINHLLNAQVSEVAFAMYNVAVRFDNQHWINICGRYCLEMADGTTVECDPEKHAATTQVHNLLDARLESYAVPNPRELALVFSNGMKLSIFDEHDMYECCSISPNIYI